MATTGSAVRRDDAQARSARGQRPTRGALPLALLLALALPAVAPAATIRLDTTLAGADFDAILDGFPGLAPFDGFGDLPGNALAVSLKDGVTEERAIVELPLAALAAAGVTASDVATAVLTFNVDDVLSTFGPGTDFDGTAGERVLVSTYAGDGVVDLDDFAQGALAGTVTTGAHGAITDASLRSSGPVVLTVDLTASVKQLLAQGATHVGIVLATDDTPTGTSIDDRGDGGTGAPGAGGATMPFLVVTTVAATPTPSPAPTPTAAPTAGPTFTAPPTATAAPTSTPSPSPGATRTPGPSATPAPTATGGPVPTPTPAGTPTPGGPTPSPGASTTPGATPTSAVTATPNGSATPGPTATPRPTGTPGTTATPAASPTAAPSATPAASPTLQPGVTPSPRPVLTASPRPTGTPGSATPAPTGGAVTPLFGELPAASGDQLVFYYDARDGFTTFLNLHNLGTAELDVAVVLYDAALGTPLEQRLTLDAGATRTLDVGALRADGLAPRIGAAFAVAVDGAGAAVVSRALAGSFTVANLATGSAWGAAAPARRALAVGQGGATTPALGAAIAGAIRLRAIRPDRVALAVYYDPDTLEPAALGGNQVLALSFDGDGASPRAALTTWHLAGHRNDGAALGAADLAATGVTASHLTALLGESAGGAAGSIVFTAEGGAQNRLVFFTESLGTFATGYLLPPVAP